VRPIRSGGRAPIRSELLGLCRPGLAPARGVLAVRLGPVIPPARFLRVRSSCCCWRCGEKLGLAAIGASVLVAVVATGLGETVRLWVTGLWIPVRLWVPGLWIPVRLWILARLCITVGLDITGRLGVAVRLGHEIRRRLVRTGLACDVGDVARRSALVKFWAIRLLPAISVGRAIAVRRAIALTAAGGWILTAVVLIATAMAAHAVVRFWVPVIRSSSVMRL